MQSDSNTFFRRVYGDEFPERVVVWTNPGKRSHWPRSPEEAGRIADAYRDTHNVYVGVAFPDRAVVGKEDKRGDADKTVGIVGLWCELDFQGPGHKKPGLPTEKRLLEAIDTLDPAPSLVIHSGGGVHLWWVFARAWIFADDSERDEAAQLEMSWQAEIRRQVKFTVDPTHDLARVLRVADTKNHKGQEPVPVTILKADGPRLAVEDWQNLAKGWPPAKEKTRKPKDDAGPQSGPSFTINPNAKPDADWLETLRAVDSIRDTLDDRRGFPSPSECDMSLTSSLARVPDMTDQSIIDLCVWHRRVKHNKPPSHRKAYETTLRKARTAAEDDDDDTPTMTAEDMEIVKILQVCDGDGTPPRYRFVTPSGSMTLPDGSHILEQRKFRIAVLNTFKVALRSLRNENWEPFVQRKLTPKIETTHPGDPDYPQRGARDETLEWIADYLDSRMAEIEGGDDVTDAPFKMNGVEHIMPAHFNEWLKTNRNETFTNHGLHLRLSDVGWHSKKVRIPKGPTVNRWVLDASRARTQTCGHPREETPEHAEQAS